MGRIVSRIERPPAELVARFAKVMLSRLVGGIDAPLLMDGAIKPLLLRDMTICGPAVTVVSPQADLMMGVLATGVAQKGDVIVISPGGDHDSACWGGGLTRSCDNLGCGGVVIDGVVEDSDVIVTRKTPVFSRGATLRKREPDGRAGSINVDIVCGGVPVRPGDLIVGDSDGVVVVPMDTLAGLIDEVEAGSREVQERIATLEREGQVLFDRWGGQDLVRKLGIEWCD